MKNQLVCAMVVVWLLGGDRGVQAQEPAKTPAAPAPVPPPRLALVATERGPELDDLLALVEAKLSAGSELALVERRQLERVLTEHKWSLGGFLSADQVLKAGKLMGADLFAVLQTNAKAKEALGLVVFHTGTGVRLWDAPLSSGKLNEAVAELERSVRGAVRKHLQRDQARTICLTTVRNVDLPRAQDDLCDTVGFFLERGLVASSSVALLERSRLDQVLREQNLPTDSPLRPLLASLIRVELEVGRAEKGKGLRATALLFNNAGKALGKPSVEIEGAQPADLAEALLKLVVKEVGAEATNVVLDRAKEAQRFAREADFFYFHTDIDRELRARQAALALTPDDVLQRWKFCVVLHKVGGRFLDPYRIGFKNPSPEEMIRCLEYAQKVLDQRAVLEPAWRADPKPFGPLGGLLPTETFAAYEKRFARSYTPEVRALLDEVRKEHARLADVRFDHQFALVKDRGGFETLAKNLVFSPEFRLDMPYGLTETQHAAHRKKWAARFLELAPKHLDQPLPSATLRHTYDLLRLASLDDATPAQVRAVRARLRENPSALLDYHERWLDVQVQLEQPDLKIGEKAQILRDYRLVLEKVLVSEVAAKNAELRLMCYRSMCQAMLRVQSQDLTVPMNFENPVGKELAALGKFMLARKDLCQDMFHNLTQFLARIPRRADDVQAHAFAQGMIAVLDDPAGRFLLDGFNRPDEKQQRGQMRNMLVQRRQQILARYPDLEERAAPAWAGLRELLDIHGKTDGLVRLARPLVQDGFVYVAALGQDRVREHDRFVQLLRFSLDSGERTVLGKLAVDTKFQPPDEKRLAAFADDPHLGEHIPFAVDACIHAGRYYLGTRDSGIIAFSLTDDKVEHLLTDTGLPSNHVQKLLAAQGQLIAALGERNKESYLIVRDLKTEAVKVIASSRRKDVQSAFDDTSPWRIHAFLDDPARQRVLLFFEARKRWQDAGLWELNLKSAKLRHVLETKNGLHFLTPLYKERVLLATFDDTSTLDFAQDKKHSAHFQIIGQVPPYIEPRLRALRDFFQKDSGVVAPGHFVEGGWLYLTKPFARMKLDGSSQETLLSPRTRSTSAFYPFEGFIPAGDQVILGDAFGLWVARMK